VLPPPPSRRHRWLVVALLSAVRFRHRMPWCRRWGGGLVAAAATTTRTTWRCCTGGGWTSATPTPTAPMRWRGVVIDNLSPSLFSVDIIIFTSTKSEHSDSPWCEPITPLFSEVYDYRKPKNMPVDGPSNLVGRTDTRIQTMFCQGTKHRCLWTGPYNL
jgi:hypothetical protein